MQKIENASVFWLNDIRREGCFNAILLHYQKKTSFSKTGKARFHQSILFKD